MRSDQVLGLAATFALAAICATQGQIGGQRHRERLRLVHTALTDGACQKLLDYIVSAPSPKKAPPNSET